MNPLSTISPIDPRIIAAFAATYILWGCTYLGVAVALTSIPPFLLMGSRSIVGGAILLAYARWRGTEIPPRLWLAAAACGFLLFVGCHGVMAVAQQRVPSGITAIILATIPFWIAILGFIIPGEKPARLRTLALLVPGIAGVALIALSRPSSGQAGPALFDLGLLLVSSISWALGSILLERSNSRQTSAVAMSGMALVTGGAMLIVIGAAAGELGRFSFAAVSPAAAFGWIYLVLAGTILAFGSYVWLLERVSPTLVSTYTFVNPVIAVLLGWAILGETSTTSTLGGGGLVVISIIALLFFDPAPAKQADKAALDLRAKGARIPNAADPQPA